MLRDRRNAWRQAAANSSRNPKDAAAMAQLQERRRLLEEDTRVFNAELREMDSQAQWVRGRAAELEDMSQAVSRLEAQVSAAMKEQQQQQQQQHGSGGSSGGNGTASFAKAESVLRALYQKLQQDARRQSRTPARGGTGGHGARSTRSSKANAY